LIAFTGHISKHASQSEYLYFVCKHRSEIRTHSDRSYHLALPHERKRNLVQHLKKIVLLLYTGQKIPKSVDVTEPLVSLIFSTVMFLD